MQAKLYHGSCVCGRVKFEVALDLASGTFKCNCTVCTKGRFWGTIAKAEDLKILSGEDQLTVYGEKRKHNFCRNCGTKVFGRAEDRVAVNLGALDDLDPREWAAAPVKYYDGRNDHWDREPEF